MDNLRASVADSLIDICYLYETTELINQLCESESVSLDSEERKALDVLLSCIGIAAALYALDVRYGKGSRHFHKEVQARLKSRLAGAGLPSAATTFQISLVDDSFRQLQRHLPSATEYTAGDLSIALIAPVAGTFPSFNIQSSLLHLWLFIFVSDALELATTILTNAETKYQFSI